MPQDTQIVLPFARLGGKNLIADFEGGTLSSDGGVLFLREIEAQVGIIRRFAAALDDPRDARYTDHSDEELLSQRIFQTRLFGSQSRLLFLMVAHQPYNSLLLRS